MLKRSRMRPDAKAMDDLVVQAQEMGMGYD